MSSRNREKTIRQLFKEYKSVRSSNIQFGFTDQEYPRNNDPVDRLDSLVTREALARALGEERGYQIIVNKYRAWDREMKTKEEKKAYKHDMNALRCRLDELTRNAMARRGEYVSFLENLEQ